MTAPLAKQQLNVAWHPLRGAHDVRASCRGTKDKIVEILRALGWTGAWELNQVEKRRGNNDRWQLGPRSDNRGESAISVYYRAGNAGTWWSYWLSFPKKRYTFEQVYETFRLRVDRNGDTRKLQDVTMAEALVPPQAKLAEPRIVAPPTRVVTTSSYIPCDNAAVIAEVESLWQILGLPFAPVHIGEDMFSGFYRALTPAMSDACLQFNEHNRDPRTQAQKKYGEDMAADDWHGHHQGIAFAFFPTTMIDGQNRLKQAVKLGITIPMMVTFNVPRDSIVAIDCQAVRTVKDSAKMTDVPTFGLDGCIKFTMKGFDGPTGLPSNQALIAFAEKYNAAFAFVGAETKKHTHTSSIDVIPVRAALLRAYYHVDRARLAKFIEVTHKRVIEAESKDGAALTLANRLIKNSNARHKMGQEQVYALTTRALWWFCERNENTEKLEPDTRERYELPLNPPAVEV